MLISNGTCIAAVQRQERRAATAAVTKAAELLDETHPLHGAFVTWCRVDRKGATPSKRLARKYLAIFKCYREQRAA